MSKGGVDFTCNFLVLVDPTINFSSSKHFSVITLSCSLTAFSNLPNNNLEVQNSLLLGLHLIDLRRQVHFVTSASIIVLSAISFLILDNGLSLIPWGSCSSKIFKLGFTLKNWIKSIKPHTRIKFLLCSNNGSSGTQETNEEVLILLHILVYKHLS